MIGMEKVSPQVALSTYKSIYSDCCQRPQVGQRQGAAEAADLKYGGFD